MESIENIFELPNGTVLRNIHSPEMCAGRNCTIHNPSDHHMSSWPLHWRNDRKIFERICEHGVGHPDPDSLYYEEKEGKEYAGLHGCCGCCTRTTNVAIIDE